MKKISLIVLTIFIMFVYRTQIFNLLIKYEPNQQIQIQDLTDTYWKVEIDNIIHSNSYVGIVELNDKLIRLVAKRLQFGKHQTIDNPNKFRDSSVAHCVGYSALNASLLNYAVNQISSKDYEISHVRGQIKFLGYPLTSKQNGNFYKHHDFVKIENIITGNYYFCDATVYELFRISRIKLKYGM